MNKARNNINFAFFGTPELATIVLDELAAADLLPSLIVTNPDKPKGRGQKIQPPPAKVWGQKHDIQVLQPQTIDEAFIDTLADRGPFDVFVVAAYGKILPEELIDIPAHGSLNVHPSLLPKERGAAPIRGAILNEDETGVSIMKMDEQLDHGPIVAQEKITEWSPETGGPPMARKLHDTLAHAGGKLLAKVMPEWVNETIEATPQDHERATYTHKFDKTDGEIDPEEDTPYEMYRKYAAFYEWPRTFFYTDDGTRVIVSDASFEDGEFIINKVIPAGKDEMDYTDFKKSA